MADSDTETHSGDELHKATYGKANLALIGKDTSGLSKYAIGIPAEIDQEKLARAQGKVDQLHTKVAEFTRQHEGAEERRDDIAAEIERIRQMKIDLEAIYRVNQVNWNDEDWTIVREFGVVAREYGPNLDARVDALNEDLKRARAEETAAFSQLGRYEDRLRNCEKDVEKLSATTTERHSIIPGFNHYGGLRSKQFVFDDLHKELKRYEKMSLNNIIRLIEELRDHYDRDNTPRGRTAINILKGVVNTLNELKGQGVLCPLQIIMNVTTLLPQVYMRESVLRIMNMSIAVSEKKKKDMKKAFGNNGYIPSDKSGGGGGGGRRGGRGGRGRGRGGRGAGQGGRGGRGGGSSGGSGNTRKRGACHGCGEIGHIKKNCPHRKKGQSGQSGQVQEAKTEEKSGN